MLYLQNLKTVYKLLENNEYFSNLYLHHLTVFFFPQQKNTSIPYSSVHNSKRVFCLDDFESSLNMSNSINKEVIEFVFLSE